MSGDPADFEQFVDFDYTRAAMTIQFNANGMKDLERIIASVEEIVGEDPAKTITGGYSLVEKEMSESIVSGQYNSLIFAFIAIFLILAIIFKSIPAGLLGSLPLLFAVVSTFGFMGWLGIKLDIVTALLSSVSIGLGVDFTIHMFWRMKSEISSGREYKDAAVTALRTAGRGITINALSVMLGFSILFFSSFPIIKSFALLIILSLLFCLVSSLLLVPAICVIFKPSFLKNGKHHEINKIHS
jgi:predicted RND superfamily exporter protein